MSDHETMKPATTTSAKRSRPRTAPGLKCVAAIHAWVVFGILVVVLLPVFNPPIGGELLRLQPGSILALGLLVLLGALFTAIAYGLLRRGRWARWASILTSLMIAAGSPLIGAVLIMYLIRPELDRHFM